MTDTPESPKTPNDQNSEGNTPQINPTQPASVPPTDSASKAKVKLPKKPNNLHQFQNDPKFHQKGFNTNLKSTIRRSGPRGR